MDLLASHCAAHWPPSGTAGLLERDIENSYLAADAVDEDPLNQLLCHSITYRIAVEPQQGRKVFTLQTLPASDPEHPFGDTINRNQ